MLDWILRERESERERESVCERERVRERERSWLEFEKPKLKVFY